MNKFLHVHGSETISLTTFIGNNRQQMGVFKSFLLFDFLTILPDDRVLKRRNVKLTLKEVKRLIILLLFRELCIVQRLATHMPIKLSSMAMQFCKCSRCKKPLNLRYKLRFTHVGDFIRNLQFLHDPCHLMSKFIN